MSKVLDELVTQLALEKIEENLFRGQSQDLGWGTVFGGQVLGQALSAAVQTVPPERQAHSLHAYFLRPGNVSKPIVYQVDRIRDGGSFTTRRVVAVQSGHPIFNLAASFQTEEEGFAHSSAMPEVPAPETLPTEGAQLARLLADLPAELLDAARVAGMSAAASCALSALATSKPRCFSARPSTRLKAGSSSMTRIVWGFSIFSLPP